LPRLRSGRVGGEPVPERKELSSEHPRMFVL
jgi:hypothetical protein